MSSESERGIPLRNITSQNTLEPTYTVESDFRLLNATNNANGIRSQKALPPNLTLYNGDTVNLIPMPTDDPKGKFDAQYPNC